MKVLVQFLWTHDGPTALKTLKAMISGVELVLKKESIGSQEKAEIWVSKKLELSVGSDANLGAATILDEGDSQAAGYWFVLETDAETAMRLLQMKARSRNMEVIIQEEYAQGFDCPVKSTTGEVAPCKLHEEKPKKAANTTPLEEIEIDAEMIKDYKLDLRDLGTYCNEGEAAVLAKELRVGLNICEYMPGQEALEESGKKSDQPQQKSDQPQKKPQAPKGLQKPKEILLRFVTTLGRQPAHLWLLHTGNHYEVLIPDSGGPYTIVLVERLKTTRIGRCKRSPVATRIDGSCLIDAIVIATTGHAASDEEIVAHRKTISTKITDEDVVQNLSTIIFDCVNGNPVFGLGSRLRDRLPRTAPQVKQLIVGSKLNQCFAAADHLVLGLVAQQKGPLIVERTPKTLQPLTAGEILAGIGCVKSKAVLVLLNGSIAAPGAWLLTMACPQCGQRQQLVVILRVLGEVGEVADPYVRVDTGAVLRHLIKQVGIARNQQYTAAPKGISATPEGAVILCRSILQARKQQFGALKLPPAEAIDVRGKSPIYVISSNRGKWLYVNAKSTWYGRMIEAKTNAQPIIFVIAEAERDIYQKMMAQNQYGQGEKRDVHLLCYGGGWGIGWNRHAALRHAKRGGARFAWMVDDDTLNIRDSGDERAPSWVLDDAMMAGLPYVSLYPGIMQQALGFNLELLGNLNFCPYFLFSKEDLCLEKAFLLLWDIMPTNGCEQASIVVKFDKSKIEVDVIGPIPSRKDAMRLIASHPIWRDDGTNKEVQLLGELESLAKSSDYRGKIERLPYDLLKLQEQILFDCFADHPQEVIAALLGDGWFYDTISD